MKRPLCRMGHPILRQKAREVSKSFLKTDELGQLINDLFDSMKAYGGIGIAAPQVGIDLRIAIVEVTSQNRYGEEIHLPLTVFINPTIHFLTDETQGYWEGCLSVPGLRGFVERPRHIRVTYLNQMGAEQELIVEGFLATVLQHELDHLDGILYVDRVKDTRLLSYQEEFDEFLKEKALD